MDSLVGEDTEKSHELDSNQYQATFPLVDREWVCRPPRYSPSIE